MKDWKGNQIEVGHTLLIIEFKNFDAGHTPYTEFKHKYGPSTYLRGNPIPVQYRWEIKKTILVIEPGPRDIIYAVDVLNKVPINELPSFLSIKGNETLCIKGLSDNEQDFFIHHISK